MILDSVKSKNLRDIRDLTNVDINADRTPQQQSAKNLRDIRDLTNVFGEVNMVVAAVEKWCADNSMQLNISKSKHVLLNKNLNLQTYPLPQPLIQLNSEAKKYHGITFYNKCFWKLHFSKLYKKALQKMYSLRRLRNFLPRHHLILFYYAAIRSTIEYFS